MYAHMHTESEANRKKYLLLLLFIYSFNFSNPDILKSGNNYMKNFFRLLENVLFANSLLDT